MNARRLIPIAEISDGSAQMRVEMKPDTVREYADEMAAGTIFPAVVVYYDGADYWLGDGFHRVEAARLLEAEIDRYLDPTLEERVSEVRWNLRHRLRQIEDAVTERHQDEIDELTSDYEEIFASLEAWEESAKDLWSTITEDLEEAQPDLDAFEKPKARPANEPGGFVLFDSKRDYLTQMDRYHEWQRRDA